MAVINPPVREYNTEPVLYVSKADKDSNGVKTLWDFEVKFREFELYAVWGEDKEEGNGIKIEVGLGDMLKALAAAMKDSK